jgi:hypothetical protein
VGWRWFSGEEGGGKREGDAGKWKGIDAEVVGAQEKWGRGRSGAVLGARERGGDEDQRDPKGFRPNLSRRLVPTAINSTAYDLDDANSREQQANPSRREELLGWF